MTLQDDSYRSGILLLVAGLLMIIVVFFFSLYEYMNVSVQLKGAKDILGALTQSSDLLMELLFKIAFLGMALAAGATLIKHSVSLLKKGGKESEGA